MEDLDIEGEAVEFRLGKNQIGDVPAKSLAACLLYTSDAADE